MDQKILIAALKKAIGQPEESEIEKAIKSKKEPQPIIKFTGVKKDDLISAFEVASLSTWDIEIDWDANWEQQVNEWNDSFDGAKLVKVPMEQAAKKYTYYDNGRRIKGTALKNPIIVGHIGGDYTVLDGNHRLISRVLKGDKTDIKVLILEMPRFFDPVLEMDSVDGDHFWETKEIVQ